MVLKKSERKININLGGIAKGRKVGVGDEENIPKRRLKEDCQKGLKNG